MRQNTIFLDTEFTDLHDPVLLSIGMVTADGQEHYAELDRDDPASAATFARASDFVLHGGVLDQWGVIPGAAVTRQQMGERTAAWLLHSAERLGRPVLVVYDYRPDFDLVVQAIRAAGLWETLQEVVHPLNVDVIVGTAAGEDAAERCFDALRVRGIGRHHALADALALRAVCLEAGPDFTGGGAGR